MAVYKGRRLNLGFSNHPLSMSGCVQISKTTPFPDVAFPNIIFLHIIFYTFLVLHIKRKFIAHFQFYEV